MALSLRVSCLSWLVALLLALLSPMKTEAFGIRSLHLALQGPKIHTPAATPTALKSSKSDGTMEITLGRRDVLLKGGSVGELCLQRPQPLLCVTTSRRKGHH